MNRKPNQNRVSHTRNAAPAARGSALVAVLVLILAIAIAVAAVLRLAGHDVSLTQAHNEYKKALAVAEAGLERAFVELRKAILETGNPPQEMLDYIPPPELEGFKFAAPNETPVFDITAQGERIESTEVGTGRWAGLNGNMQTYHLRVGATDAKNSGVVLQQTVQLIEVPVCRFAALYQDDLEVFPASSFMQVTGPVHTNADLFVGASSELVFRDLVRAAGRILRVCKHSGVYPSGVVRIEDSGDTAQEMMDEGAFLDHTHPEWPVIAFKTWDGTVLDSGHRVPPLTLLMPPSEDPHCMVERAQPDDHPLVAMHKFDNKADLVIRREASGYPTAYKQDGTLVDLAFFEDGTEQPPSEPAPVAYVTENTPENTIKFSGAAPALGEDRQVQTDIFTVPVQGPPGPVNVTTKAGGYEAGFVLGGPGSTNFDELGFETQLVSVEQANMGPPPLPEPDDQLGLLGGHIDVDTSSFIAPVGDGTTDGHVHEYDNKYDTPEVDLFNILDFKLHNITSDIPDGSTKFKLIIANADLSPGAVLLINSNPNPVPDYDDTELGDLPVYSFDGVAGTTQLTGLVMGFDVLAIAKDSVIPTNTGDVKGNVPGKNGEWRNGALTLQAVAVNADGSDAFATDLAISAGGVQGVATSGLLYECTIFWHWKGPSYHEPDWDTYDPYGLGGGAAGTPEFAVYAGGNIDVQSGTMDVGDGKIIADGDTLKLEGGSTVIAGTAMARQKIDIADGQIQGDAQAPDISGGPISGAQDTSEPPAASMLDLDKNVFKDHAEANGEYYTSDQTISADKAPAGGVMYVKNKNVKFTEPCTFTGCLVVENGNILWEKDGNQVQVADFPAFVTFKNGNITFKENMNTQGLVYSEKGNVEKFGGGVLIGRVHCGGNFIFNGDLQAQAPVAVGPPPGMVDIYTFQVNSVVDTNPLTEVTFEFPGGVTIHYGETCWVAGGGNTEGAGPYPVAGGININPSNSPNNEFNLTKVGGGTITRDDLHRDAEVDENGTYYEGPAQEFFVKPKGNGNQNTWIVNGEPYRLLNKNRYTITGDDMHVRIYNAKMKNGKAMGHWWIETSGTIVSVTQDGEPGDEAADVVEFTGSVERITVPGLRRVGTVAPFADAREGKTMHALDIDFELLALHPELGGGGITIYAYSEFQLPGAVGVVRVLNGGELPSGGLTVASPDPVYVRGHFNASGTNQPALICGDAVTFLSAGWSEETSWAEVAVRTAADTTVRAVVLTGATQSEGDYYSGGLENALRLIENWTGRSFLFRGSVVCLWDSQIAVGPFVGDGDQCAPPESNIEYDDAYRGTTFVPPDCPTVAGFETLNWSQDSWREDELAPAGENTADPGDGDRIPSTSPDGTN